MPEVHAFTHPCTSDGSISDLKENTRTMVMKRRMRIPIANNGNTL